MARVRPLFIILPVIVGFFPLTGCSTSSPEPEPTHGEPKNAGAELERAKGFAAASCQCFFDLYDAAGNDRTGIETCVQKAADEYAITPVGPNTVFEIIDVDGLEVKQPKHFDSLEANHYLAQQNKECMMSISRAVVGYGKRTWKSDASCEAQCGEEAAQKKMCVGICKSKQQPLGGP